MSSRATSNVGKRRALPSSVPSGARPVSRSELFDGACVRLVDAVMADDRPTAEVAAAEAVVMARLMHEAGRG